MSNARRWSVLVLILLCCLPGSGSSAQDLPPLPLEVAVSLQGHNGRSPIQVSPDGTWVAHTVQTDETVPRGTSRSFAATGFPFAEGDSRMEATLSHVETDETIRLGAADAASWGAVWSPDGRRVAFYSDEGDEAGLWIWERATAERRRVGDFVVRPFFGFETVRWAPDGRRLLVKVLPEGTTLAEANALMPADDTEPPPPEVVPGEPSVEVRLSTAARQEAQGDADGADGADVGQPPPSGGMLEEYRRGLAADLAVVDIETGQMERLVRGEVFRRYAFSPDGEVIVSSMLTGFVPDSQQPVFDLRLHHLESGTDRTLAEDVMLSYGIEWSWSPDGSRIAYTSSGQLGTGRYNVVRVDDGSMSEIGQDTPHFSPGEGEVPPLWSPDGGTLYGVGDGALWRVDPDSGEAREIARISQGKGWDLRSLVTPWYGSPVAWSADDRLWLVARETGGWRGAIVSVDPVTGQTRVELQEDRAYSHVFSTAASSSADGEGGRIFFVARDQRQPGEIETYEVGTNQAHRVSRINGGLASYALGEARLIEWKADRGDDEGEPLAGALLLPPGHESDQRLRRLPLAVWVYGGSLGSRSVGNFGFWGAMPTFNMHVLASRGYAVLAPDAPVRPGRITEDLVATVLPGIDAAIEQGYADPDRVAIMGQSFGALNVLALLTRTDRFGAAVITAAVQHPDLVADYLSGRASTGYYEGGQGGMAGTPWEVPERYRDNSPVFDFPEIETPLLVGQGSQDGDLVPANAIFAALERLGKQVELRIYQGEGHVVTRDANVVDFWQRRLDFLARHLDLEVGPDGAVTPRR